MIKADRKWNEEAARQQLLKFFEALGFSDPLAVAGRKRLSTHPVLLSAGAGGA